MMPAQEILDSSRMDAAYHLHKDFSTRLNTYAKVQQQTFRGQLEDYQRRMSRLKNAHEACPNCSEAEDHSNALSSFLETADSAADIFFTSLADRFDEASSTLSDSSETLSDSLITFVETLVDNRETELDSIETHSNKLLISADANSTAYYHGRDGGKSQAIVSPLISFRHSSGFKLSVSTSWLDQQENHWDATSLGLSYEFAFSPASGALPATLIIGSTAAYTQERSVFNQSVNGEIDLSTSIADFSLAAEINFGQQSEYHFEFTATHEWQFGRKISLAPSVIASWGEQNLTLLAKRIQKIQQLNAKGKKIVTKKEYDDICQQGKYLFQFSITRLSFPSASV